MAQRLHFDCEIPPEIVEAIAERAVALVESRLPIVDEWLTSSETAEYLRCPISRVYAFSSLSQIPCHRDGSRLLFKRSELDAWIKEGGGRRPGHG